MGLFCHAGGVFVSDVGGKACDEHERAVEIVVHFVAVGFDAADTALVEGAHAVGQQPDGLQEIIDHDGHEDIELKIALRGGDADRRVVAHDLHGNHGDGLALGRVDLARHDGGAGFIFGDGDLTESQSGPRCQPADIVGDLEKIGGERLERSVGEDQLVLGGQGVEFIIGGFEGSGAEVRDGLGNGGVKAAGGVETRTDGGAAQREGAQMLKRVADHDNILFDGGAPAADLLREADRRGVLQMGTAAFDHVGVFFLQAAQRCYKIFRGGEQGLLDGQDRRDMHGGGEGVVGRLGHIDVVIGVQQRLACELVTAVGDDLVGVHIALGAAARLPDDERKVIVELALDDLVAGRCDGSAFFGRHFVGAQGCIGERGSLFEIAEGADDLAWHDLLADGEVFKAALGLCAPVTVCGDGDGSHGVVFYTERGGV